MIGAIIGAGLSIAGSLIGSHQQRKAAEAAQQAQQKATERKLAAQSNTTAALVQAQREQKAASNGLNPYLYSQNALIRQNGELIRQRNAERRRQAKMGQRTTASALSGTKVDADALGNVAENAESQALDYKKQQDAAQRQSDANFKVTMAQQNQGTQNILADQAAQNAAFEQQKANASAQATAGIISAAGSLASAIDSTGGSKSGGSNKVKSYKTYNNNEGVSASNGKINGLNLAMANDGKGNVVWYNSGKKL